MRIVLIGAGRLAASLAKALHAAGHDIIQVYSRTIEAAEAVASEVNAVPTADIMMLDDGADMYITAVRDDVLADLVPVLCGGRKQKVFVHTAGSIPMDVFENAVPHYGVLYPMQSFSKERDVDFSSVPCFIEASDDYALEIIEKVAMSISRQVRYLSSEDRKYLHLAAVFACNFVNHCYAIAADILDNHGLPFDVILPLIEETARKVHDMSPVCAQTGPAVRYDRDVIRSQSMLLKENPLAKDIYDSMSLSIHQMSVADDKL